MTDHAIELRKPTAADNTRRYEDRRYVGESFGRGERIIMVDGLRWGRTFVISHGSQGTSHTFKQDRSDVISDEKGNTITVRISSWRSQRNNEPIRPTDELILEKASELVRDGKLRHPDVVKAEHEEASRQYGEACRKVEEQKLVALRAKAMEALRINDPSSEMIERVVEAMKWAQTR